MKKLKDLSPAWKNRDNEDQDWEKDRLIDRLEAEGHRTISVERAVLIVEQCEGGDSFPKGWSGDPLKITIFPDPDAGFGQKPDELYINAGRSGLMDLYVRKSDGKLLTMVGLEADASSPATFSESDLAKVDAIALLVQRGLGGNYQVHHLDRVIDVNREGKEIRGECATVEHDPKLEELGCKVLDAIAEYRKHLEMRPGLFRQWRPKE